MIKYALKCGEGHDFESWFQSAAAFDKLAKSGRLSCAVCANTQVKKAIMAPKVGNTQQAPEAAGQLTKPQSDAEKALSDLRKHVEKNADYVGGNFAQEARSMYLGTTPERAIYGEANGVEAKALLEDGIPVAPLPFLPNRKTN